MLLGSFISSDSKLQGLDLGAGTGVLSLMLAQKNQKLQIDAVEIDANVANECDLNFQNSKWRKNLKCIAADYLQFPFKKKYDLIFRDCKGYKAKNGFYIDSKYALITGSTNHNGEIEVLGINNFQFESHEFLIKLENQQLIILCLA